MFNFFKRPAKGNTVTFKISGMHCTSCCMNIDGELEDVDGVISASTSYAKAQSVVEFDPDKVTAKRLQEIIRGLGYKAEEISS